MGVALDHMMPLQVTILKPITSSPTSPERFLVCKGYLGCKPIITEVRLLKGEGHRGTCTLYLYLGRGRGIGGNTLSFMYTI